MGLWMLNGKILGTSTQPWECDHCPCSDAAPCTCDEAEAAGGLVNQYKLGGGLDGTSFSGCVLCDDPPGGYVNWNGKFGYEEEPYSDCYWELNEGDAIGGKWAPNKAMAVLSLDEEECRWQIALYCIREDPLSLFTIWIGYKTTGMTPVGSYAYDDGCDGHSTLSIVEA